MYTTERMAEAKYTGPEILGHSCRRCGQTKSYLLFSGVKWPEMTCKLCDVAEDPMGTMSPENESVLTLHTTYKCRVCKQGTIIPIQWKDLDKPILLYCEHCIQIPGGAPPQSSEK